MRKTKQWKVTRLTREAGERAPALPRELNIAREGARRLATALRRHVRAKWRPVTVRLGKIRAVHLHVTTHGNGRGAHPRFSNKRRASPMAVGHPRNLLSPAREARAETDSLNLNESIRRINPTGKSGVLADASGAVDLVKVQRSTSP